MAAKEAKEEKKLDAETLAAIRSNVLSAAQSMMAEFQKQLSEKRTQLDQLAAAYIEAVRACKDPVKNATNPHLKNTYADLGSVLDAARDAFLGNGLWLMQAPGQIVTKGTNNDPYQQLNGILIHKSGQTIPLTMELPAFTVSKSGGLVINPQTAGSAISYARRYMWLAVAGLFQVDDDADQASYVDDADPPARVDLINSTPSQSVVPNDLEGKIKKALADKNYEQLKALREDVKSSGDKGLAGKWMAARDVLKPAD